MLLQNHNFGDDTGLGEQEAEAKTNNEQDQNQDFGDDNGLGEQEAETKNEDEADYGEGLGEVSAQKANIEHKTTSKPEQNQDEKKEDIEEIVPSAATIAEAAAYVADRKLHYKAQAEEKAKAKADQAHKQGNKGRTLRKHHSH